MSTSKSVDNEIDDDFYSRSSVEESDQMSAISADGKLSALTPIRNVEIGALIPLSANGEARHEVQVMFSKYTQYKAIINLF